MNFERLFGATQIEGNAVVRSVSPEVVTLGFLSRQLPSALISQQLAESLCLQSSSSVVLVRLQPCDDSSVFGPALDYTATVVDWAPSDLVLQGQFRACSLIRAAAGFHILTVSFRRGPVSPEWVTSLLAPLRRHFRFVLVEADDEVISPLSFEFLKRSDRAYLFVSPAANDIDLLNNLAEKLLNRSENTALSVKGVACLGNADTGSTIGAILQDSKVPIERYLHDCPDNPDTHPAQVGKGPFSADVRRLAREICGKLIGLALSSGAAKGFAHIGVIQVLEENGIEVDMVAGASIGAYIGALWTYGKDGQELEGLAREMESRWNFWSLIDPIFPPRQGFLRGYALRNRLMRSIGTAHFADLTRPLRVIAGNLATLERIAFCSGEVAQAVHASMAVPGICVPVKLNGESYIDGGIVEPVPVESLREMGASRIIAVNTIPTPERMRKAYEEARELARLKRNNLRRIFRKVLPLDKQLNYFARGNLFEILVRSIHGAQARLAESSCRLADVVLRPDVCDDRWIDCRNPGRFIALGRQVAARNIDQIKALVAEPELNNEQQFAPRSLAAVA